MDTNGSTINPIFWLAALGLTLAVTGVQMFRRHRAAEASGGLQNEIPEDMSAETSGQNQTTGLQEAQPSSSPLPETPSQKKKPLVFFLLLFAITVPYWIFGGKNLPIPVKLPVSAFGALNPMIAALILTFIYTGSKGVKQLFARAFDHKKIKNKLWYIPILLLPLLIYYLSYVVMLLAKMPLPEPEIPILLVPVMLIVFFLFGIGEELGWMGYAIDPLQDRWGALKAAAIVGFVWGLFHLIPDLQNRQTADWILWQRLGTILLRIIMVWIYNSTGRSVFSSILFHASNNLGWSLFPNFGTHYDPMVTGIILALVTGMVLLGTEPKTLTRKQYANVGHNKV